MVTTYTVHTHMRTFKVNGQSVPKTEWKQTKEQTDGGDYITSLANRPTVGNCMNMGLMADYSVNPLQHRYLGLSANLRLGLHLQFIEVINEISPIKR